MQKKGILGNGSLRGFIYGLFRQIHPACLVHFCSLQNGVIFRQHKIFSHLHGILFGNIVSNVNGHHVVKLRAEQINSLGKGAVICQTVVFQINALVAAKGSLFAFHHIFICGNLSKSILIQKSKGKAEAAGALMLRVFQMVFVDPLHAIRNVPCKNIKVMDFFWKSHFSGIFIGLDSHCHTVIALFFQVKVIQLFPGVNGCGCCQDAHGCHCSGSGKVPFFSVFKRYHFSILQLSFYFILNHLMDKIRCFGNFVFQIFQSHISTSISSSSCLNFPLARASLF